MARKQREEEVVVRIGVSGTIEVDAVGFKGKSCLEATKEFEKLGKVTSRATKPEYRKSAHTGTSNRTRIGR